MAWRAVLESLIAFFALLGFLGIVPWLAERLFGAKNVCIAIEILTQRDADAAEVLIRDALFRCLSFPSAKIVLLVDASLWDDARVRQAARTYGVCLYLMPTEKRME